MPTKLTAPMSEAAATVCELYDWFLARLTRAGRLVLTAEKYRDGDVSGSGAHAVLMNRAKQVWGEQKCVMPTRFQLSVAFFAAMKSLDLLEVR